MSSLSPAAGLAWQVAASEASRVRHPFIEREHLLIGVCSINKTLGFLRFTRVESLPVDAIRAEAEGVEGLLRDMRITPESLRRGIRSRLRPGFAIYEDNVVHRSEACKELFRRGREIAEEAGSAETRAPHLLRAILEDPGPIVTAVLTGAGVPPQSLRREALTEPPRAAGKKPAVEEAAPAAGVSTAEVAPTETPLLDRYGRDITKAAREGKLLPFVESERTRNTLRQLLKVLLMPTKNNPVLVGESGVGKTAVVEALAEWIARGRDQQVLTGKRVVELSMAELVAGTKYRGEFEERLTRLIDEVRHHPEVVLFIDEFHTVVGAGRAEGAPMDAGNIMKPALARGELRCIGATTIDEYRKSVEKDPALERRFQSIHVAEPARAETLEILTGLRPHREAHFGVSVTDESLTAAVDLAIRFDPTRALPDKAIDLLDRACAECRVPLLSLAVDAERNHPMGVGVVRPETVATVVSEKMGIPIEVVRGGVDGISQSRIRGLEEHLNRYVIGQEEAIGRVCRRLLLAHAGLGDRRHPLGVFLFLGPSGVGKTEVARRMASYLFADERAFIRLDLSEYQEDASVTRLIGASPGYVGYEEGGQLTGRLRTTPYCVVLLDEIEKAAPHVHDLFLQLFDEGRITDAQGRRADARNAVFIMTGNVPVEKEMGFLAGEPQVAASTALAAVRRRFRPEFLNRIDEQIVFRSLDRDDVLRVLRLHFADLEDHLQSLGGVSLDVDPAAMDWLAQEGYSPEYGIRELARIVDRWVRGPIGQMSVSGDLARRAADRRPLRVRKSPEGVTIE